MAMRFTWPLSLSLALAANLPQVEVQVEIEDIEVGLGTSCSCAPSADASDQQLDDIRNWNCARIYQAKADYAKLATHYGQSVDESWTQRLAQAQKLCGQAQNETNPLTAASTACCAWGDVLMSHRECCNVAGPPYCVSNAKSKLGRFSVLLATFLAAGLAALCPKCCKQSYYAPSLLFTAAAPQRAPLLLGAAGEGDEECGDGGGMSYDPQLFEELKAMWGTKDARTERKGCSMRNLPGADDWGVRAALGFARLQRAFDFQQDSVKNQFEHLITLWRSHCSVNADRMKQANIGLESMEEKLVLHGLQELYEDLLCGFRAWRREFRKFHKETPHFLDSVSTPVATPVPSVEAQVRWCKMEESDQRVRSVAERYVKLEEVAMFLLVWGEAGNLRFMPEMLYFIMHLMLEATPPCEVRKGVSNVFLAKIVRPIYHVVFEEHYKEVKLAGTEATPEQSRKDDKKLKDGFDRYLPPDCPNHDDWNELFQDMPRLHEALEDLLSLPSTQRYQGLKQVDWHVALQDTKTHRELHSFWGVFAATHRLWFLHLLLFLLSMFWVSSRNFSSDASGWKVLLGGNSPLICLSAVGLLVPLHFFAWKLGRWFTTGHAKRSRVKGSTCCLRCLAGTGHVLLLLLQAMLMCIPVLSFLLVRWLDAFGELTEVHPMLNLNSALWLHVFVCCFGALLILLQPFENGDALRHGTASPWSMKFMRWGFWLSVLAVKFVSGLGGIAAIERATTELKISRPGRESLEDLPRFAFGPNWDKDMIEWLALWGTGLICYVADTQFWFCLGCSVLGFVLAFRHRGWRARTLVTEDALAAVPMRYAERVILAAPRGQQHRHRARAAQGTVPPPSAKKQWYEKWFPDLWDRIIDFMRYEDKLDDFILGQLKFTVDAGSEQVVSWEAVHRPLKPRTSFMPPPVFAHTSCGQRSLERDLGVIPEEYWPKNPEVRWRLNAFARNLAYEQLPRPFLTPYMPGLTVLIPHYGEQILLTKKDLKGERGGEEVPLISWLEKRYHRDFTAFTSRMKALTLTPRWPDAGTRWDQYSDSNWESLCKWASMRSQTLWRTVEGLMLYLPALECFHQMVEHENKKSKLIWDPAEVFTCMVSMQAYAFFNADQYNHTEQLLQRFKRSFQIAFIDHESKGAQADADGIHKKQQRRYFSCLIDSSCQKSGPRREPRLRVELPGFPVLGDGKGDNQNHAIIFTRGSIIQAIDANQGGYFEQMLLLPCALGEFRRKGTGGLNPRIVGFAEHITSDIGSLGDFAAGAETAFGTVLQRSYAWLGARMHYGHPDMMNKEFMIQQGGVSKATKTVNLSEDIFAGMDFTLRGNGRNIVHREYMHVAKGRDLGFNTVLTFFSKLSAGTGEQLLTRQMLRLGHELDLPEFLTFYYAHAGYYLTQFFLSKSIPLLVFIWLLVVLDDPEQNFPAMDPDDKSESGAVIVARMLITQYSWLLMLFIVAQTAPLFLQVWLENSSVAALLRVLKQMVTLAPLHFVFQAKIIGAYITNEITLGGAKYLPTGRGLPTERRSFVKRRRGPLQRLRRAGALRRRAAPGSGLAGDPGRGPGGGAVPLLVALGLGAHHLLLDAGTLHLQPLPVCP
ncbi:unnamed protein product [Effrenium voratum]|nr:unnamed protein product [Effrenium voratum]